MSDTPRPRFFRAINGSRAENRSTVACALLFDPGEPVEVATARLSWRPLIAARLAAVARAAAESGKPEGRSLPYASLRAAFQVQVSDAVMLAHDLGRPWSRDDAFAFMHVAEAMGGDCAARATGALRTWIGLVLRPWVERIGQDDGLVDDVDDAITDGAFTVDNGLSDLVRLLGPSREFNRLRHPVLQEVSRRIEGLELFEGLGPVYRIVRSRNSRNEVQFQTWPTASKSGGLYSMVASLALESVPYLEKPVLVVRASRRRWLDAVPPSSRLGRQRTLSGYLMARSGSKIAVEFAADVRKGHPEEPCSPAFLHQALSVHADLARPFSEMVQARGQDIFLGVPYSPQRDGKVSVGAGASTRDQLDLLDAVAGPLAGMGMRPMPFRETADTKRAPKRAEEFHKALEAEALVADFAAALGSNELDEEDLAEVARLLLEGGEPPEISPQVALAGRATLAKLQGANRQRLRRVFGDAPPTIVLIARREDERLMMRAAVNGLFGGGINVVERQLPRNVHGTRQDLPEADKKAGQRIAARVEAWRNLAEDLALAHGGCHALVQAEEWYGNRHDDEVNKLGGRHALATIGNANVQYLLPSSGGWRGLARYLNRIQSAVYDLMFGHSALITEIRDLLETEFPDEETRPRSIIGISLATQARLRNGARGGQTCLATRIDGITGQATARIGWHANDVMRWSDWEPFFDAMKRVSGLEVAVLGPSADVRLRSYQSFVVKIIDEAVDAGDRPLVLIDSTSTAGMWPWLTDAKMGGTVTIGVEDKTEHWSPARLVRVRVGHAARVLERKSARYERISVDDGSVLGTDTRYCPTAVARTVEVSSDPSGAGRHYWVTSGYFQASLPRGLSVFRKTECFVPVAKVRGLNPSSGISAQGLLTSVEIDISDEPYRVPNGLDVTVATVAPGDRPDRIAHLVASLRCGYGHSRLATTLPAPLFFEAKARDYMGRFAIDDLDEDEGAAAPPRQPQQRVLEVTDIDIEVEAAEAAEADAEEEGELLDAAEVKAAEEPGESDPDPHGETDPSGPTLTGSWSRLLRSSLAVSLIETTSLSGQRVELPFTTDGPDPARAISRSIGPGKTEIGVGEEPTPGKGNEMSDEQTGPRWVSANRDKLLPVPEFVTPEWLLPKISLQNNPRLMREIHRWRQEIRDDSGFFWPVEQPDSPASIADTMIRGMRHANFIRVLTRVAVRGMDAKKRKGHNLFQTFRKQTSWALPKMTRSGSVPASVGRLVLRAARVLAENDRTLDAASLLYLYRFGAPEGEDLLAVAKELGLHEIEEFLTAANELADDFHWTRDILEQAGGPLTPLMPRDDDVAVEPVVAERTAEIGDVAVTRSDVRTDEPDGGAAGDGVPSPAIRAEPADTAEEADAATPRVVEIGVVGETAPNDAALLAWREAMTRLEAAAALARVAEPDAVLLQRMAAIGRNARAAMRAWEAARPRLVDAWPLVERAKAILQTLSGLQRAPSTESILVCVAGPMNVETTTLGEAETLVDDAAAALAEAESLQARCLSVLQSELLSRLREIGAWSDGADSAMQVACARLEAAAAILTEGAARRAESNAFPAPEPARLLPEVIQQLPLARVTGVPWAAEASAAPTGAAMQQHAVPEASVLEEDPTEDPGFELAEAETAQAETALTVPEPTEPEAAPAPEAGEVVPENVPDPMFGQIEDKLAKLVCAGSLGAAFHLLRAARRVFPGERFSFSEDELRLAAMSGRISHAAMQGSALLANLVSGAIVSIEALPTEGPDDDIVQARRIMLAGACAALALFHPSLPAAQGVNAIVEACPELGEAFHDLREAVATGARLTFITPALLRTVGEEAAEGLYMDACRLKIVQSVDAFSKFHFNYSRANKIRAALNLRSGVIGELHEKMAAGGENSLQAAKKFRETYQPRAAILGVIDRLDRESGSKVAKLDGAARERIVAGFEDILALCAEYVEAAQAVPAARNANLKEKALGVAMAVRSGAERAIDALEAFAESASPLPAAAAVFAAAALGRLRDIAQGRPATIGIHDHLLAVHGPLLWVPGLHYGDGWLPTPYQPEALVNVLLDVPIPTLDLQPDDAMFRAAVRARVAEGSFVAARMLTQASAFYGVGDGARDDMAEYCEADLATTRSQMKDSLDAARRLIEKVQRMGGMGGVARIDQAGAALAALDRINPDNLPAEVSLDARGEDEKPEQIMDFAAASDVVNDVCDRVRALLDGPRTELLRRLDALDGKARPGDIRHVRGFVAADELVTADEYIGFMEEGRALPESLSTNRRFHEFWPRVPAALAKESKRGLEEIREAVATSSDLEALPFSRIRPEFRSEAVEILDVWRDLRRRVGHGDQATAVHHLIERLLTAARLSPGVIDTAKRAPKLPPKTYVSEFHLTIPEDKDSLLLPDFGSLTEFNYRVCVVPKLPNEGEIANLCRDAGTYGIIVLVTSSVDPARRGQLALSCIAKDLRALVIDEAILLHTLAEPEFRPLTMFECAQPFSFAAPYRDYGNTAVPPEMFFGREVEIRKISDRMGSCVVYGGRRLGKTALLQHVNGRHNHPGRNGSTAVGYANINDLRATPSGIWEKVSSALPAIFTAPVRTAGEFTGRVRAWLNADGKRQVLLLLDEADGFIESDSRQQFVEFHRLQELMDGTARRFKFVLAGLHNVTEIVRTENSPLKQIASDPQRIGPLMDAELPDAERLVTRPMSAMGYEFRNRSDVWRILTHCNYYPVLVQVFCAGLLGALQKDTVERRSATWERGITERHVRTAIEDSAIRKEIGEKFDYTIRAIDPRYELIACVVADKALHDGSAGRVDEGMSTVEVLDAVCSWWPQAFDHANRLDIVKDLLDEMVGLGVLRQTASGAWALRSYAILRLLGDEDLVTERLLSFEKKEPPRAFDPRSMRRGLIRRGTSVRDGNSYPCPLTLGQEHDLLAGGAPVSIVFGNVLSDIGLVAEALNSAEPTNIGGDRMSVVARSFTEVGDLVDVIRAQGRGTGSATVAVDQRAHWDGAWVETAMRQKPVRDGVVRLIFIGGAHHALAWVRDPRFAKPALRIRVMPLLPWSDTYLDHELGSVHLPMERFVQELRRVTGGFNGLMAEVMSASSGGAERFAARVRSTENKIAKDRDLLGKIGLSSPMDEVFRRIADWADQSGRVGAEYIRDGVAEELEAHGLAATQVTDFGIAMGILEAQPLRPGEADENRGFLVTPLLRIALSQSVTGVAA